MKKLLYCLAVLFAVPFCSYGTSLGSQADSMLNRSAQFASQITPSGEHNIVKTSYTKGNLTDGLVQTVNYYDGFGRVRQTVDVGASPNGGDLITPVEYDRFGRASKEYLPYVSDNSGTFRQNAIGAQSSFYSSLFSGEARPYRESTYELSSMDRVKSVRNVGQIYADNGKQQSFEYRVVSGQVMRLVVQSGGFIVSGHHDALLENRTTNEDGQTSSTYTDGWGRTVATRDAAGGMTYYVYDIRGRLCYVISPVAAAQLSSGMSYIDSHPLLEKYCYRYEYGLCGNIIEKQLPGASPVIMVYDDSHRIIATQSGNQRSGNEWTVVVYDALDRETERWIAINNMVGKYIMSTTSAAILAKSSSKDMISSSFYDSHPAPAIAFKAMPGVVTQMDVDSRMQGMKSYEWVNGVGRSFYYDYKGRLVQTAEANHMGGSSYYNFQYDFVGNLLISQEVSSFSSYATDSLTTINSYDDRGRLLRSVSRLTARGLMPVEAISTYQYNSLGQMAVKKLGAGADVTNYTYNIQGWLKSQASQNFTLGLRYYDPVKSTNNRYFGGNIAEVEWGHTGQPLNTYSFSYDALSRMTGANHYVGSSLTNSFTESGLTYDLNGNILTLSRSAGAGGNKSYSMSYNGNQLSSVNSGTMYQYDANGNTIQSGKNNLQFEYNFLNLLTRVKDGAGKSAVYDWGVDGLKRKVSIANDPTSGFSYLGSLVYTPAGSSYTLESAAFPEGRFVKTSSSYEVHYHVKDHLGSVRATVNANGVVANKSDYYPFGDRWSSTGEATTNRYLFSGKEKQTAGDLRNMNLLDFGARMYDPEIPRWINQDPLTEKYYSYSPYVYCLNNPMKFIDPDGREVLRGEAAKNAFRALKMSMSSNSSEDENEDDSSRDRDSDGEEEEETLFSYISKYFTSYFRQMSVTDNKSALYKDYQAGKPEAIAEIGRRNVANKVVRTLGEDFTPYLSLSIGKESAEGGSPVSLWGGLTLTTSDIYLSIGGDYTKGAPSLLPWTSVSVSAGVYVGQKSGITGLGTGVSFGAGFMGVSTSTAINLSGRPAPRTVSFGIGVSSSPVWSSGNISYTWSIKPTTKTKQ